jgi:uncharacterized phage protein (TIGR01671 family)
MREILFRGKSKGKPEWIYGSLYKEGSQAFILVGGRFYPEPSNGQSALGIMDWYEVFPDSIGQFTGLLDKHGRKIFEGDIVNARYDCGPAGETERIVEVVFGSFGTNLQDWIFKEDGYLPEIIGNIHDNPELMEVPDENK